jgi:ABC-type Fe3+ transport system permease subunit
MAGASRMRTSVRILWPLMRPGLVYGWSMIFVLILGDLHRGLGPCRTG